MLHHLVYIHSYHPTIQTKKLNRRLKHALKLIIHIHNGYQPVFYKKPRFVLNHVNNLYKLYRKRCDCGMSFTYLVIKMNNLYH